MDNVYAKILSMTWCDYLDSDLILRTHSIKHTVEFSGSEVGLPLDSNVLVFCNVHTGEPMVVLITSTSPIEVDESIFDKWSITVKEKLNEESSDNEIVFVDKIIYNSVDNCSSIK